MATPRTPKGPMEAIAARLAEVYPIAVCELDHSNAFELLAATVLSAQTTDSRVNMVTPVLFARYPDAESLAAAKPAELEEIVRSTGFYQSKARNLIAMAHGLLDRFGGEVPTALDDLVTLAGVGRKTGNVVRSVAFGLPGLPVDTHVGRLSRRWALTSQEDPVKAEAELCTVATRAVGRLQLAHDPSRAQSVWREEAALRRMRAGRPVPGLPIARKSIKA